MIMSPTPQRALIQGSSFNLPQVTLSAGLFFCKSVNNEDTKNLLGRIIDWLDEDQEAMHGLAFCWHS